MPGIGVVVCALLTAIVTLQLYHAIKRGWALGCYRDDEPLNHWARVTFLGAIAAIFGYFLYVFYTAYARAS